MKHSASLSLTASLCALALLAGHAQAQTTKPARKARTAASELTSPPEDQLKTNALRRCENLPAFYKVDCEARVRGEGQMSGSVAGGGMLKESTSTVPATELQEGEAPGWRPGMPPPERPMRRERMDKRGPEHMRDREGHGHPMRDHEMREREMKERHMQQAPAGMPPASMPPSSMPPSSMPPSSMPPASMPPAGMPPPGMPRTDMPQPYPMPETK